MWRATAALLLAAATAADCPPPETVAAMVDAALSRPTGIGPQQCSEPVSLPFLAATYGFALVVGDAVASPRGVADSGNRNDCSTSPYNQNDLWKSLKP